MYQSPSFSVRSVKIMECSNIDLIWCNITLYFMFKINIFRHLNARVHFRMKADSPVANILGLCFVFCGGAALHAIVSETQKKIRNNLCYNIVPAKS